MTGDTWYNLGYGIVAPFFYGIAGYAYARWKSSQKLRTKFKHPLTILVSQRDVRIHELLAELRFQVKAMRAYVVQLHNGDEFITGGSMRKKSRTHEVAAPGVSYQSEHFQGVLLSSVPEEMKLVVARGPSYQQVDDMAPGKFRQLCVEGGIIAVARAAIFMGPSEVVAFVGVDFDYDRKPANLELVESYAQRIAPLLGEPRAEWGKMLRAFVDRVALVFAPPVYDPPQRMRA